MMNDFSLIDTTKTQITFKKQIVKIGKNYILKINIKCKNEMINPDTMYM